MSNSYGLHLTDRANLGGKRSQSKTLNCMRIAYNAQCLEIIFQCTFSFVTCNSMSWKSPGVKQNYSTQYWLQGVTHCEERAFKSVDVGPAGLS